MLKKLKNSIKTTTKKFGEIQEKILISEGEEAATVNPASSKKRNFQEIPPQSRLIQNIVQISKTSIHTHQEHCLSSPT